MTASGAAELRGPIPFLNWRPSLAVVLIGLLALILPTLITLGKWSWSTEAGAHGPIVLATGSWLLWHERHLARSASATNIWGPVTVFVAAFPAYFVGRVTQILLLEGIACFAICIAAAAMVLGWKTVARFWFPILYLMFMLSPPENWLFVATRPLKFALANAAIDFLNLFGMDVAGTASMILVDGYQLQVASACSGINSIIGITAIGLFYIYLRHGSQLKYAALMVALLIPVALATNFIRIILLILVTKWFGDGTVFSVVHDLGGIALFILALGLLLAIDELLSPLAKRLGLVQ